MTSTQTQTQPVWYAVVDGQPRALEFVWRDGRFLRQPPTTLEALREQIAATRASDQEQDRIRRERMRQDAGVAFWRDRAANTQREDRPS